MHTPGTIGSALLFAAIMLGSALASGGFSGIPGAIGAPSGARPIASAASLLGSNAAPFEPGAPYWLGGPIPSVAGPFGSAGNGPVPAAVNPTAYYSSEPAPMGLGDFGITSSGTPYTYYTNEFVANAHFGSLLAAPVNVSSGNGNWTTLQLNVVVVLSHGASLAEYWIQDVPLFDSANQAIYLEDNVWNFSGKSTLPTNSISGNGSVYKSGKQQYYADGAAASLPGNQVYLTLPVNISTKVVASNFSGVTHVGFLYNDGYGWQIFDNVTFPWTKGWTLRGFEVNGSAYNPLGLFDDAEWTLGGPGGGSGVIDQSSNFSMTLEYDNGHNLASVVNAYDFGSDTAENSRNVLASFPTGGSPGTPSGRYLAGAGSLGRLFGISSTARVNVTAPVHDGVLGVNGAPTPYRGNTANVSLVPGSYTFTDANGSNVLASKSVSLTAGEYLPLHFGSLTLNQSSGLSQTRLSASGGGFVAGTGIEVLWPGRVSPMCSATVASNGTYSCTFSAPIDAAGSYAVVASDNDTAGDNATAAFELLTNLTTTIAASAATTDVGGSLKFWSNTSLGYPPYASYRWDFGDGSPIQTTSTSPTTHAFATAGTFAVSANVSDQSGSTAKAQLSVRIFPDPTVDTPVANRSAADIGQSVTFFSPNVTVGSGSDRYTWSGLPGGCSTSGYLATCSGLPGAGNFTIGLSTIDSNGFSATSGTLHFTVYADPSIEPIALLTPYVDAGSPLELMAGVGSGSGGWVFTWTGLPAGCGGSTATIQCSPQASGIYPVTVRAEDSDGALTSTTSLDVTIDPDPTVLLLASRSPASDVGETLRLSAEVSGGSGAGGFAWSGLPAGCAPSSAATVNCTLAAAGSFDPSVVFTDRSSTNASGNLSLTVYPKEVVTWLALPSGPSDLGVPLEFSVGASGGSGSNYSYAWSGLPTGCLSADLASIECSPTASGVFSVRVNASDPEGATNSTSGVTVTVTDLPVVQKVTASPSTVLAGSGTVLRASVTGGSGNLSYRWSGLPSGCDSEDSASVACTPNGAGSFTVALTVTDSSDRNSTSSVLLTVTAPVLGLPPTEAYLALGIVILAIAAVTAALLYRRRRSGTARP